MRVTAKRLRRWIVAAVGLLLAVVVGFFFYGRYRFRRIARDLPARLGVNIQQTATGFSYSQSSQGHTLFTLKASKEFQMKSGHVLLHNVDITLYGPPGSGRTDHIFGSDFDYDQSQGIAISHGQVQIQLESLGSGRIRQGGAGVSAVGNGPDTIQLQTSGLTFVQKTGEASTAQPVHFELPRASGSAVGADYNSKTGVLVLRSQVHITTNSKGKTANIGATHATMERETMQAQLTGATLDYETEHGSADQATVDFRKDGTAEKVDAQGHVRMATAQGATVEAATGVFVLNAKSEPLRADLGGGVTFAEAKAGEQMEGTAEEGTLLFAATSGANGATALRHSEFRKNVRLTEESAENTRANARNVTRYLESQTVDVEFGRTTPGQPVEARRVVAGGNPVLTMRQAELRGVHAGVEQTTRVSANELVATLGAGNVLQELDGTGHTQIESDSADGARETSQGDVLKVTFREQPAKQGAPVKPAKGKQAGGSGRKKPNGPKMQTVLEAAVQDGHVVLTEIPAKQPTEAGGGAPEPMTAWADHAEYHAANDVLTLTGHPRMREGETMQLSAEQIWYHRDTQDAEATGNVKATYTQGSPSAGGQAAVPVMGGSGPVHVIAERAAMHHASGEAIFSGTAQERARMWQGPDSLLAPMIEVNRRDSALKAWGDNGGAEVLASFTSAMGAKHQQSLVSVESRRLNYSDQKRQADFQGDVAAQHGDEAIHADHAVIVLKPEEKGADGGMPGRGGKRNSEIEKMVATGHVVFTQPGRRGQGERLVYTADEGKYILTGTPEAQPQLWDRVHGTTTGAALIFNSQNDSVEVSGGKSSAVTQTRAPR